jgi:hypothetical protein
MRQGLPGMLNVAKGQHRGPNGLGRFMSFSSNEHYIASRSAAHCKSDGRSPIEFEVHITPYSFQNLARNGLRAFGTGVIAGEHDFIGPLVNLLTHEGSLAWITIPPGTENAPQATLARLLDFRERLQNVGERIRRMGVVHHHQRLAGSAEGLQASRHWLELR